MAQRTGASESAADPAAREREELLQLLYLCPVAIVKIDAHGTILLMNPNGTQLLMPLSADGNLENLFSLLAPFAPEVSEMASRYAKRAGKICEEHRFVVRPPGAGPTSTVSLTLQKVDPDVMVAVIADVTATAEREVNIRTSEERLHSVLDGVKEYAICTLDSNGIITSWNRAAERLEGYRSDEVMGRHVAMLVPTSSGSGNSFKKPLELARRDGGHEFEAWRARKDGTRFWAATTVSSLVNRNDQSLLGYSIVTRDTTKTKRSEDNLRHLASTDPLTGALNRRAFFEAAAIEQERCRRTNETLALLLFDIDHFKVVNDTHGHAAGDLVLQRIVSEARTQIRSNDVLARVGGEEFALVLTSGDPQVGVNMAERVRKRISELIVPFGDRSLNVTVSVGVRAAAGQAIVVEDMLRAADRALYAAKREGRNRVVVARDTDEATVS